MDVKEADFTCPHCQHGDMWSDIREKGEHVDINGMLDFLKQQTGESFEDWNITEAYYSDCTCGQCNVVAEVPEACDPDENGYCAPAYMILSLHNENNHQKKRR